MGKCYYRILGVSIGANPDDIKQAFRALAMRWHPDRNRQDPKASKRFREIREAYETLSNPATRVRYDKLRGYGKSRKKPPSRDLGDTEDLGVTLDEVLAEAFGIGVIHGKSTGITDLRFDLQVSSRVTWEGAFEEIHYARWVFCPQCRGDRRRRAASLCEACKGSGEVEMECFLRVTIPPGCREGTRLRIRGAGDQPVAGAAPGDLVILLHVVEEG